MYDQTTKTTPDYDAILNDMIEYVNDRDEPNGYIDLMASQPDGSYDKALAAKLKGQIERGKQYHTEGYRVKMTDRIVEGHADMHDLPEALAITRRWSGYLATSPTYRKWYLVKR